MSALDSPQFKDYAFRVDKSSHGVNASVAKNTTASLDSASWEPLGSFSIYSNRHSLDREQRTINEGGYQHYEDEEPGGQRTWGGGNLNPDRAYVGWAAMAETPHKGRLLGGMAALAVAEHGSMPAADANLSYEGARLARGAARKFGMKPLPGKTMEGGFDMSGRDASARREAESAWNYSGAKHLSAAQVAGVVKGVEEEYRVKKPKSDAPAVHPGQQRFL